MYQGKYCKRVNVRWYRMLLLVISIVLLVNISIVATMAFLSTSTDDVINTFTAKEVPNKVVEDFDGTVKKNVMIQNMGEVDAYIRAAVTFSWLDSDGNVYAIAPIENVDYSVDWRKEGWEEYTNKTSNITYFYYVAGPVSRNDTTSILISECKLLKQAPEGYNLSVEIMGQSIQARGMDSEGNAPVELKWPVTVNADGSLTLN